MLLSMGFDAYEELVLRNQGIIARREQQRLRSKVIAVAGCGAGGAAAAISIARLGARRFRLADPDIVDKSNINRQEGAFYSSLGVNKARAIARLITDIDPAAEVQIFDRGVIDANVDDFLNEADALLEEIDYRQPRYTLLVHRAARRHGVPVFTGIPVAWNAFLFHFTPDGMTYEEYIGLPENTDNLRSTDVRVTAYVPEPPTYISESLLKDVLSERVDIPAVDPAVRMAAALTSTFTFFYLTNLKKIRPVPFYYSAGDLFLKEPRKLSRKEITGYELLFSNAQR